MTERTLPVAVFLIALLVVFGSPISPGWFVISLAAITLVFVVFWRFGYLALP